MAATVTVTGVAGPAKAVTATVFSNVDEIKIDTVNNVLQLHADNKYHIITVSAATTVTATKSGATWTLTIS
jgi:hypothetical protein